MNVLSYLISLYASTKRLHGSLDSESAGAAAPPCPSTPSFIPTPPAHQIIIMRPIQPSSRKRSLSDRRTTWIPSRASPPLKSILLCRNHTRCKAGSDGARTSIVWTTDGGYKTLSMHEWTGLVERTLFTVPLILACEREIKYNICHGSSRTVV